MQLLLKFKLGITIKDADFAVPYDLFDMAEDVNQLMNALQIEQCHVLGMSMGGMIAQILASDYAHRVQSIGLLATSNNRPFLPPPSISALRTFLKPDPDKSDERQVIDSNLELMRAIGSTAYMDEHRLRRQAKRLVRRRFYPKGVNRQLMAVLATGSLHEVDTRITQPTLIVHGDADRLLPPAHAKSLAKSIPHATLDIIPRLGHDIPYPLARFLADRFATHFLQVEDEMIDDFNLPD